MVSQTSCPFWRHLEHASARAHAQRGGARDRGCVKWVLGHQASLADAQTAHVGERKFSGLGVIMDTIGGLRTYHHGTNNRWEFPDDSDRFPLRRVRIEHKSLSIVLFSDVSVPQQSTLPANKSVVNATLVLTIAACYHRPNYSMSDYHPLSKKLTICTTMQVYLSRETHSRVAVM